MYILLLSKTAYAKSKKKKSAIYSKKKYALLYDSSDWVALSKIFTTKSNKSLSVVDICFLFYCLFGLAIISEVPEALLREIDAWISSFN